MARSNSTTCSHFGIDFDYDVGKISISLHGELDALGVPAFGAVLCAIAERGTRSVTIDLSALRFCNVGGLRVMAELAARLNEIDGRVEIVAPAILTRMLEISDLHSLFVIADPGATRTSVDFSHASRPVRPERSSRPRRARGTACRPEPRSEANLSESFVRGPFLRPCPDSVRGTRRERVITCPLPADPFAVS